MMLYDWFSHMTFGNPYAFLLLALIPLLVWWDIRSARTGTATIKVSSTQPFQTGSWKTRFRFLPLILRILAVASLVVAIARPQQRNDDERTEGEGIDIVLCMDVSGSMGTRDILPSRMEVAKEMAVQFVQGRPVDRIGLVIFSGESFTLCPVTSDRNTLINQIENLESAVRLRDGTVIGEGLATAVDRLSKSNSKSKVIILITDGKEDAPDTRLIDPITALEIAKTNHIKVYTIGIGAKAQATVTLPGTKPSRMNPAIDFIDEQLLQRIANETGGRYFRARDKEGLSNTYHQIDQMEKSKVELQAFKRFKELYLPYMLAAIFFLVLEALFRLTVFRRFP